MVTNLGQFGAPHNPWKDLDIAGSYQRGYDSVTKAKLLKVELGKYEREEKAKAHELAEDTHVRISKMVAGKLPEEQNAILSNPTMTAIAKDMFKEHLPEVLDDKTGLIIPDPMDWVPRTMEEKKEWQRSTLKLKQKIAANAPFDLDDIEFQRKLFSDMRFSGAISVDEWKRKLGNLNEKADEILKRRGAGGAKLDLGGNDDTTVVEEEGSKGPWWMQ